ncbi:DUF983 domain-containing protein [Cognatishimia activa]|nr:DUF983 domain-containing protein [Cognatishimia activa]
MPFLTVRSPCSVCGEPLSIRRYGLFPVLFTLLLVAPIMGLAIYVLHYKLRPDALTLFSILAVGCVALTLYLLPRMKGAVLAFEWRQENAMNASDPGSKGHGQNGNSRRGDSDCAERQSD